jgi:glucuronide carrier protein
VDAIRLAAGIVPAVFILIGIAIFFRYPLTEQTFARMVAETAERRAARVADTAGTTTGGQT